MRGIRFIWSQAMQPYLAFFLIVTPLVLAVIDRILTPAR